MIFALCGERASNYCRNARVTENGVRLAPDFERGEGAPRDWSDGASILNPVSPSPRLETHIPIMGQGYSLSADP